MPGAAKFDVHYRRAALRYLQHTLTTVLHMHSPQSSPLPGLPEEKLYQARSAVCTSS